MYFVKNVIQSYSVNEIEVMNTHYNSCINIKGVRNENQDCWEMIYYTEFSSTMRSDIKITIYSNDKKYVLDQSDIFCMYYDDTYKHEMVYILHYDKYDDRYTLDEEEILA